MRRRQLVISGLGFGSSYHPPLKRGDDRRYTGSLVAALERQERAGGDVTKNIIAAP